MKIMVIGAKGSLGSEICKQLNKQEIPFLQITRNELDINTNIDILEKFILSSQSNVIINCIALLGIENCKENTQQALEINSLFPNKLFLIAKRNNLSFIQISTECIFSCDDINLFNFENDNPNPNTTYGLTKRLGECYPSKNFHLVRLPLLFGNSNNRQIISKLTEIALDDQEIKVSNDIITTPVYTPDVASWIIKNILDNFKKFPEIVHLNSSERISMYDFMVKILSHFDKEKYVISVSSDFFPSSEPKPKFGGLSSNHHNGFDLDLMINSYVKSI
jgi:dTDP-4-dehydrorhamnose reductase